MAKMLETLTQIAARLQAAVAQAVEQLRPEDVDAVLADEGVQRLLADPEQGEAWKAWVDKQRGKMDKAPPPPPSEDKAPPPPAAPPPKGTPLAEVAKELDILEGDIQLFTDNGVGNLEALASLDPEAPPQWLLDIEGRAGAPRLIKAAIALATELADEKPAEPKKPKAKVEGTPLDILAFADQETRQGEEFRAAMNAAYDSIVDALANENLSMDHEVDFVSGEYRKLAITWLQIQVARNSMSVAEAVSRAKTEGWTEELKVHPRVYRELMAAFKAAGLFLQRKVFDRATKEVVIDDLHVELAKALETGTPIDTIIQKAIDAGWTRPFEPRDDIESRVGPDKAEEVRKVTSRGRSGGRRTTKK